MALSLSVVLPMHDEEPRSRGRSSLVSPGVIVGILVEMGRLAPELRRGRLPAGPRRGQ